MVILTRRLDFPQKTRRTSVQTRAGWDKLMESWGGLPRLPAGKPTRIPLA